MKKSTPLLRFKLKPAQYTRSFISFISCMFVLILLQPGTITAQSVAANFPESFIPGFNRPQVSIQDKTEPSTTWESIQSVEVKQNNSVAGAPLFFAPVKLNLDQVRNGAGSDAPVYISPVAAPWVNGNAGASNAHYAEGWSIPYRVKIENLVGTGPRSVDIEWDIRQSNSSAIDFVTNYDFLDYPPGSHVSNFGHVAEYLNPISDEAAAALGTSPDIPTPNFGTAPAAVLALFNTVQNVNNGSPLDAGKFTIYNASIDSFVYITQGSVTAAASSTRMRVYFTNTASTVVLAWGGHIAKGENCWGIGNSAAAVSGSPYHTRLLEWDADGALAGASTSLGNQDRSLSADAVLDPPACTLNGPASVQCGTNNNVYTSSGVPSGYTYTWTLTNNTSGSSIDAATLTSTSATVIAGSAGCPTAKGYTIVYTIFKNGIQIGAPCTLNATVTDNTAPVFTGSYATVNLGCNPTNIGPTLNGATATDGCGTPTVNSGTDGADQSSGCLRTRTRTFTATDGACNTATISRSVTWTADVTGPVFTGSYATVNLGCNPTNISGTLNGATATDGCGTPTVNSGTDGSDQSSNCLRTRTRTFTATDACGNTSTISRSVTWTADITQPVFTGSYASVNLGCNPTNISATLNGATATDGCGTPTVNTGVDGADQSSGCLRTRTRTFTATDACGNTATISRSVIWTDDNSATPPAFTGSYATVNLGCNPTNISATLNGATATDGCGTPTVNTGVDGADQSSGCLRTRTRTFTATDACGNTATISRSVTWTADIAAPGFTGSYATVNLGCNPTNISATLNGATATDGCGTPTVNSGTDGTDQSNGCLRTRTRTFTATDACGNTATISRSVTWTADVTPPVLTCAADVTVDCGGSDPIVGEAGVATATDACGTPTVVSEDLSSSTSGCQTLITRKWTATDACGNTATCVQHIIVRDRTAPVITCHNDGTAEASDNCGGPVTLYLSNGTWTAIDESGNVSTKSCPVVLPRTESRPLQEGQIQPVVNNTIDQSKNEKQNISEVNTTGTTVTAYPNPFNSKVKFLVMASQAGYGTLELINMQGQLIKTIYQGQIPVGGKSFEITLPAVKSNGMIYRLKMGDKQITGKLIQLNQ